MNKLLIAAALTTSIGCGGVSSTKSPQAPEQQVAVREGKICLLMHVNNQDSFFTNFYALATSSLGTKKVKWLKNDNAGQWVKTYDGLVTLDFYSNDAIEYTSSINSFSDGDFHWFEFQLGTDSYAHTFWRSGSKEQCDDIGID